MEKDAEEFYLDCVQVCMDYFDFSISSARQQQQESAAGENCVLLIVQQIFGILESNGGTATSAVGLKIIRKSCALLVKLSQYQEYGKFLDSRFFYPTNIVF
jgi:hypothetical protein